MTDKITHLPSDPAERKRLKGVIEELVNAQVQLDAAKDLIKSILDTEKETHGYDLGFIKDLATFDYDYNYNEQKKIQAAETKAERIEELNILMGRSE